MLSGVVWHKWLLPFLLFFFLISPVQAQEPPIHLPLLFGSGDIMATNPVLIVTDGNTVIDLIGPDSGWKLADPYWNPGIAAFKGGGSFLSSSLAEGRRLTTGEYDNVIETIPLSVRGIDQDRAIRTIRELMQLGRQASDYWTKPYEYDDVWLEARPACNSCFTGYSRIVSMRIPELTNPYGQPFFGINSEAIMEGITVLIEREPFWRAVEPGSIIGPIYNLIDNPSFELWNFGVTDSQPDSWTDLETLWITGSNNRQDSAVKWGQYALKIRVGSSTQAGAAKGVTQVINDTENATTYTILAWVRSEGVSNGVGRILVNYSSQLELYRSSDRHGWTLYHGTITTGNNDVVSINCEILTTAANTDGTIYIDGLMFIPGDWEQEAVDGVLPYMSGSHIVNHWDSDAGNINYVDVWNIPGDIDALTRVEFVNDTDPADPANVIEVYSKIRVGMRRTNDIFNFDNYHDPVGVADATASAGDRLTVTGISTDWNDATTKLIIGGINTRDNEGRFRVFARIYDNTGPNSQARLRYFLGIGGTNNQKTLDYVATPIQDDWCMVDLTPNAAMIIDRKFSHDPLAQFGYTVQLRRTTGTQNVRFDYSLVLPTDGGYFECDISPAIQKDVALIVDNTNSQQVSAAGVKAGYVSRFDTADDSVQSFVDFNGYLYSATSKLVGGGNIFRSQGNNVWTKVYDGTGLQYVLATYNSRIYAGQSALGGVSTALLTSADGLAWSSVGTIAGAGGISEMKAYGGKLYAVVQAAGVGYLYQYDGSALSVAYIVPSGIPICIEVYKGLIFIGTNNGRIYTINPATNAGSLLSNTGESSINALRAFKGVLYIGVTRANAGRIYTYDGSALTLTYEDTDGGTVVIQDMQVYNNKLYATRSTSLDTTGSLLVSEDGVTFESIYDTERFGGTIQVVWGFNDVIYIGVLTSTAGLDGYIFAIVPDREAQYGLVDFQGGYFFSPNRDVNDPHYHRWVFSYDRENYINTLSDKALVGFGYVPRYLALRGRD